MGGYCENRELGNWFLLFWEPSLVPGNMATKGRLPRQVTGKLLGGIPANVTEMLHRDYT